jgi:Lipopolysaccharide core biosynthesis protein (WaaY)
MHPVNGEYQRLPLDFRLCRFDLSSTRRGATRNGCVVNSRLQQSSIGKGDLPVVCKVVDALCYPDVAGTLKGEACAYAALEKLQGKAIPTVYYGFYEVHLLALEPVGDAIPKDEEINKTLRTKMKAALQQIHDAGFVHGDITRDNFCKTDTGEVFLVDLESCRAAENPSELEDEMNEVDGL